jgi:hypothetical protein
VATDAALLQERDYETLFGRYVCSHHLRQLAQHLDTIAVRIAHAVELLLKLIMASAYKGLRFHPLPTTPHHPAATGEAELS